MDSTKELTREELLEVARMYMQDRLSQSTGQRWRVKTKADELGYRIDFQSASGYKDWHWSAWGNTFVSSREIDRLPYILSSWQAYSVSSKVSWAP